MKKTVLSFVLIACLVLSGCARAQELPKQSRVGFYFDTVVTLTAYHSDAQPLDDALELCGFYERLLSKTVEGSDVWNINHANGQPVEVSDDMRELLTLVSRVYELSHGAFDPTIANATALWDFKAETPVLPDKDALAAAAATAGFDKLKLEGNTVILPAGMMLDLGGVAKGYIADRVAALLRKEGVAHAVISLGGNVVTLGDKPDGSQWRVGIQDPDEPTGDYLMIASVGEKSVVTSGVYERGFDLDGVRYHHILDTKTGYPVQNGLSSVTIFSESSAEGDALSTAVFALGLEEGKALVESLPGVDALFITDERDIQMTSGAGVYLR